MRRTLLALLLLTPSAHAQDSTWWDPAPLLVSLRSNERAGVAQAAGVADLSTLPLYDLGMDLDDRSGSFALHEELWFTNRETTPLADVVLRLYVNTTSTQPGVHHPPQRIAVHFDDGRCSPGTGTTCTVTAPSPDVIVVTPSAPLAPGARLRIVVNVSGTLPTIDASRTSLFAQGMEGMATMQSSEGGGDGYGLLAMGEGIVSLANFYPMLARRVRGQWERTDASTMGDLGSDDMGFVRAHLRVPAALKIVSTGVEVADHPAQGRTPRTVEVVAAMVRDFCVMASRDFEIATSTVNGTTVRSVYLPRDRAAGRHVLDVAAQALADFERRFGPYPYADLDVVEASLVGGAGGVEFAALVTVASMFYKPALDAGGAGELLGALMGGTPAGAGGSSGLEEMQEHMREFVTAHEVAHQWWHGIVGSDSRAHPFQDEGLAQWSAMLYLDDRYGHARARREGDMQVRMNYQMMRMQGGTDAPVDQPVEQFASPLAYAGLVYGKGPYFYDAVRHELGDTETFTDLQEYVRANRFRMAPPDALEQLFARGRHARAVHRLSQRWLQQTHGDEDLGRGDPRQMMAGMMGVDPSQLPPQADQIMRMLGNGSGSQVDPASVQQMLEMLGQ